MYAFRCKNCGRLEHGDNAGENVVPHSCTVCGHGVSFHPQTGIKNFHLENWEILHECHANRLQELGLKTEQVYKHEPFELDSNNVKVKCVFKDGKRVPKNINRDAIEGTVLTNK